MEIITSLDNANVKMWCSLKQKKNRDKYGLFMVEEKHLIEEAAQVNLVVTLIARKGKKSFIRLNPTYVSDQVMAKIQNNKSLNDYVAICRIPPIKIDYGGRFVILENVQDPGNVGTIIRTSLAFGYDGVFLTGDCADIYNEKTVQASQGAIMRMPLERTTLKKAIDFVHSQQGKIIATLPKSEYNLSQATKYDKYAILLGNEGNGLSKEAIKYCDESVRIEMDSFESLNVASAAAICLYFYRYYCK
ncbi:MAG: RNA methyltransferase [Erysipelotrichia bacterium]|nr:RNA methyltransferase [Erysipelotrichia bacterium]